MLSPSPWGWKPQQPLQTPARQNAAKHKDQADQASPDPQLDRMVPRPSLDPMAQLLNAPPHHHHGVEPPARVTDQPIKHGCPDHQQASQRF